MRLRASVMHLVLAIACILPAIILLNVSAAPQRAQRVPGIPAQARSLPLKPFTGFSAQALAKSNLSYRGGPVITGTANIYAIFWEPSNNVAANYNTLILQYFNDVGSSPLYQIASQYTQSGGGFPSNARLAASWMDGSGYPESPLLDSDIHQEVLRAQQVNGWVSSIHNIFFVFTGRGEDLCSDSSQVSCTSNMACAYHGFFGNTTLYAAMPYAASFSCDPGSSPNGNDADQEINLASHEEMEAVTDPLVNAWLDSSGAEIGDRCGWNFGPRNSQGADVVWNGHPYIVQQEWDNASSSCRLTPSLNVPAPGVPGPNVPTPISVPGPGSGGQTGPIRSALAGKCLDDNGNSSANGTPVQIWDCNRTTAQQWSVEADGTIQINGKCMDAADNGTGTGDGTLIQLWDCSGRGNQQWQVTGGEIKNPQSGLCLDDPYFDSTNGTQLQLWDCNGGANQQWTPS